MARYEVKVNRPGQVEVGYSDGTVTIRTGHADEFDEFVIDCATDENAMDLAQNIIGARLSKLIVERAELEGTYGDPLHVPPITSRVRQFNADVRSVIRDAYAIPKSRGEQ